MDISDKLKTPLDLQKSIMWDVKAISSKDTIESRIKSNIKLKALYLSKKYAIGFSINDLDKYFDHYIVIGFIYNTNKKFRKQFERSIDAFSINLWRGKVWGVRFGRRKRLKSVYN